MGAEGGIRIRDTVKQVLGGFKRREWNNALRFAGALGNA